MVMKYLDPKADLTFKKIFGNHPKRLISLLNALLPLSEEEQIHEIKYLPTELVPQLEGGKNTIVDVLCTDVRGRKFCVEMQMEWSRVGRTQDRGRRGEFCRFQAEVKKSGPAMRGASL